MNTEDRPHLDGVRVHRATLILRALSHRYRSEIMNRLMICGKMSPRDIAYHLGLEEPYICEHLDFLLNTGLVQAEDSRDGLYFSANEHKYLHVKQSLASFCENSR